MGIEGYISAECKVVATPLRLPCTLIYLTSAGSRPLIGCRSNDGKCPRTRRPTSFTASYPHMDCGMNNLSHQGPILSFPLDFLNARGRQDVARGMLDGFVWGDRIRQVREWSNRREGKLHMAREGKGPFWGGKRKGGGGRNQKVATN